MRVATGKLSKAAEWNFVLHADGRVSIGIVAREHPVKANKALNRFTILDVQKTLPVELDVMGIKCRPKLILKLYCQPGQQHRRRLKALAIKGL